MTAQEDGMQRTAKDAGDTAMRGIEKMFEAHDDQISALGERMSGIEKKMDSITGVLQDIRTSMAASAASQQARSPVAFGTVLSYIRDGALLLGLAVSAIVYVVQGSTGAHTAVMEYRIDELQRAVQHGASPAMNSIPK